MVFMHQLDGWLPIHVAETAGNHARNTSLVLFYSVLVLELFLGKEKVKKTKHNSNVPFSSFLAKFLIYSITKLLLPSGAFSPCPRDQFCGHEYNASLLFDNI